MTTKPQFLRRSPWGKLLGGLLVLASAAPAHAQFGKISEKDEIQAGKEMARQAIQQYGQPLSASDPRQQRVNRIGALFVRQASRKNIPYTYTVLQNDKVLNAFAGPGGPIFVTTKLISTATNDAELAYVLGHETGHIEEKHIVNAMAKQQKAGLLAGIAGAILGRGGGNTGNVVGAVTNVGFTLWQKGFSRDQERQADDYGIRAMSRLGFDPRAAVSMLSKLGDGPEGASRYLSDHPTSESREERATKLIQSDNLVSVAQKAGGPFKTLSGSSSAIYQRTGLASDGRYDGNRDTGNPVYGGDDATNPIDLRVQNRGGYRVVLAPVADVARYAGGQVDARGDRVTASRGNSYVTFTANSDRAILNGRNVQLSAPAQILGGRFFAPLGTIATGLDGSASYDQSRNAVRLQFEGGPATDLGL